MRSTKHQKKGTMFKLIQRLNVQLPIYNLSHNTAYLQSHVGYQLDLKLSLKFF